jgi:serpin B
MSFTKFAPAIYKGFAVKEGNLFLSPYSIQVALGLVLLGANGKTRETLAKAIDAPEDNLAEALGDKIREVNNGSADYALSTANSLWIDGRYDMKPNYLATVAALGGEANKCDFREPTPACNTINRWVSDKTNAKITDLISPAAIDADTRLILTNAVYFKGAWEQAFETANTRPQDFHINGDSTGTKVPQMNRTGKYAYCESDTAQFLDLPYKGGDLSMLVVLPNNINELPALEKSWDVNAYDSIKRNLTRKEVVVSLPKFKVTTPVMSLGKLFSENEPDGFGAGLAFSNSADFSGIGDEPLKIADILHKAFVEVNEEGTEAAAATGVVMKTLSAVMHTEPPKIFNANRPFMFMIRNHKTGNILFQGRICDPR